MAGKKGNRSKEAENYPLDLVHAILRGMAETMEARKRMIDLQTEQWDLVMALQSADPAAVEHKHVDLPSSSLRCPDGTNIPVDFSPEHFKNAYRDEYTGEILPMHLVKAAIAEELA